ncbi:hypothetical protein NDU88_010293 [Pleurodeles waltl]|uniref:Uncharacterized protein n=1 Tax=Pleurodeles waltl TaxID=8319 RepID=A0AAV7PUR5_PLEWA|nr:hypothetical protein NDU88_010293 [Pleurodeles waltl]
MRASEPSLSTRLHPGPPYPGAWNVVDRPCLTVPCVRVVAFVCVVPKDWYPMGTAAMPFNQGSQCFWLGASACCGTPGTPLSAHVHRFKKQRSDTPSLGTQTLLPSGFCGPRAYGEGVPQISVGTPKGPSEQPKQRGCVWFMSRGQMLEEG